MIDKMFVSRKKYEEAISYHREAEMVASAALKDLRNLMGDYDKLVSKNISLVAANNQQETTIANLKLALKHSNKED